LDLVVISAIAVGNFRKPQEPLSVDGTAGATHGHLTILFVSACVLWNLYCFVFLARFAFPNFWVERAATLSGDCLGHCYLGLLFARTLDPTMDTPVPAAYLFKLMLFFMPSTGEKVSGQHHPTRDHIMAIMTIAIIAAHWFLHLLTLLTPFPYPTTRYNTTCCKRKRTELNRSRTDGTARTATGAAGVPVCGGCMVVDSRALFLQ
jgi:hypothetical protein